LLALAPKQSTRKSESSYHLTPNPLYSTGTSTTTTKENKRLPRQLHSRSSPAPSSDSVLQLINDRLSAITQELGDIRQESTQDLTDIRKNITDLP